MDRAQLKSASTGEGPAGPSVGSSWSVAPPSLEKPMRAPSTRWAAGWVATEAGPNSVPQLTAYVSAFPWNLTLNSYVVPHAGPPE